MRIQDTIVKPRITEKSIDGVNATNTVSFVVQKKANKNQIKSAIESLFDVKVGSIKTITRKGKFKRTGKRMILKQNPDIKIAYIQLKSGDIHLFPKNK